MRRLFAKLRRSAQRGDSAVTFVLLVPVLILVVGLVVDTAGQIQASEQATSVAQAAARAGANGGADPELPASGTVQINPGQAAISARQYLDAAGLQGTVAVNGRTVTVTAQKNYSTKFLSMFVSTLTGTGSASAQLLSEP